MLQMNPINIYISHLFRLARLVDRRGVLAPPVLRDPDRDHGSVEAEPEQPEIRFHAAARQWRWSI